MNSKKKKKKEIRKKSSHLEKSSMAIIVIILIFAFSTLFGFINADILAKFINPLLENIISQTEDLSGIELTLFIFINNSLTSILGLLLGIFFGIFPIIISLTNGIVLGYVLERTAQISILSWWRLLPHGIFELPAVFISLGLGLKLGIDFISTYWKRNKKDLAKKSLGIISITLALISTFVIRLITNASSQLLSKIITIFIGILLLLPFILLFFITDKKIRKENLAILSKALTVFFKVVIPLLIIAAIIEGALITLLP